MKKVVLFSAVAIVLGAAQAANASEWTFLAGNKDGYKAEPIVSLMVGSMDFDDSAAKDGDILGIEVSLNCPLLQPPTNRIRQQASITSYDESGVAITNIEINPHYVVEVADHLEVGGGPGLGYMASDGTDMLGFQLGASVHYTGLPVFIGAEWRMQFTTPADSDASGDADNSRWAVKLGYAF